MMGPVSQRHRRAGLVLPIALPLMGLLLSIAAHLVPDRWILEELADPKAGLDAVNYGVGPTGWRTDKFTECIALTIGLRDSTRDNPVSTAVRSPTLGGCSKAVPAIADWQSGERLSPPQEYLRYWHGSATLTRPSVALVGVGGTRIVVTLLLVVSLSLLASRLTRAVGLAPTIGLLGPFVLTTDLLSLPELIPHGMALATMFAATHLVLDQARRRTSRTSIVTSSFIAGAMFVYVDLLTNPPAAWALTISVVGLMVVRARPAHLLARQIDATVGWVVGYAWMWVAKWMTAALVIGPGAVRSDITSTISLRLSGEHAGVEHRVLAATTHNLDAWWDQPMSPAVVLTAVLLLVVWVGRRAHRSSRPSSGEMRTRCLLAAPALVPFVWFEVLRNHSQIHAFFTFRSVAISLGIVLAAILAPVPRGDVPPAVR